MSYNYTKGTQHLPNNSKFKKKGKKEETKEEDNFQGLPYQKR